MFDDLKLIYEIISIKDMSLYTYISNIKTLLIQAKKKQIKEILFINGYDLISTKFNILFPKHYLKIVNSNPKCYLWLIGNIGEYSSCDILNFPFEHDTYTLLYDDLKSLKTEEKSKGHWKTYGKKEFRFASIGVNNNRNTYLNGISGIYITIDIYDEIIKLIENQTYNNCKNVFIEFQKSKDISQHIYSSYPELFIPKQYNKILNKNMVFNWYLNHYRY